MKVTVQVRRVCAEALGADRRSAQIYEGLTCFNLRAPVVYTEAELAAQITDRGGATVTERTE